MGVHFVYTIYCRYICEANHQTHILGIQDDHRLNGIRDSLWCVGINILSYRVSASGQFK